MEKELMLEGIKRVMNYCVNDAIEQGITPVEFIEMTKTSPEVLLYIKEITKELDKKSGVKKGILDLLNEAKDILSKLK